MERLTKQTEYPALYSYIVAYDHGNAPNPDFNICTLAICKPVIRRSAQIGDIIVGLSPKHAGNNIIYCMVVENIVSWKDYYIYCKNSKILHNRIPTSDKHNGDCIWIYQNNNTYTLLDSKSKHNIHHQKIDITSGRYVLISKQYWYFGSNNPNHKIYPLPYLLIGRGHRKIIDQQLVDEFILFFNQELEMRNILSYGKYGNYFK